MARPRRRPRPFGSAARANQLSSSADSLSADRRNARRDEARRSDTYVALSRRSGSGEIGSCAGLIGALLSGSRANASLGAGFPGRKRVAYLSRSALRRFSHLRFNRCSPISRQRVSFSSICMLIASTVYRRASIAIGRQRAELEPVRAGDQRVAAAGLSLGQDLAGNACVAFSMIADLDRAARSTATAAIATCISKPAPSGSGSISPPKRWDCGQPASARSSTMKYTAILNSDAGTRTGGVSFRDRLPGFRFPPGGLICGWHSGARRQSFHRSRTLA